MKSEDVGAFPPLAVLSFLPLLYLQALLLHPSFSTAFSSTFRRALLLPTIYLIYRAPLAYAFEPRNTSRGPNASFAIVLLFAGCKSLEWGLANDRRAYEWVGFDGRRGKNRASNGEDRDKEVSRHPVAVLLWTVHLASSVRGLGYRFCSPPPAPLPRVSCKEFLARTLFTLVASHAGLLAAGSIISATYSTRLALAHHFVPFAPRWQVHVLVESVSYVAWGSAAYVGILVCSSVLALAAVALHSLASIILPPSLRPLPFDSREYAPLFNHPYAPQGVQMFWKSQWHSLFRRSFQFLIFDPVNRVTSMLAGRAAGRCAAILATFGFTAWVHEYAIDCAMRGLDTSTRTTFLQRFGACIFFLLMGTFSILEQGFTRLTGRQVSGIPAVLYGASLQTAAGVLLYSAWVNLEFTNSLPPVQKWAWQRFVVPISCVAPAPLWTVAAR